MALSGPGLGDGACLLLGVKRTSRIGWPMSANDPKRTPAFQGQSPPVNRRRSAAATIALSRSPAGMFASTLSTPFPA